ncbi:MAG: M3 family oligoendopeptidase [Treponema sp.]|jgi:pepF/M3 family oligoendopeptidase|nr:M3 family oligoendopeptidase [Treponema sp.]
MVPGTKVSGIKVSGTQAAPNSSGCGGPENSLPPALPRWNLKAIYPSFDSEEYRRDLRLLRERIGLLLSLLEAPLFPASPGDGPGPKKAEAAALLKLIGLYGEAENTAENLEAYAEAVYTTDTRNSQALAAINTVEEAALPLKKAAVLFGNRLAENRERVLGLVKEDPDLAPYGFFLAESLEEAAFRMPAELEDLANDLSRSGGDAWSRLQEAISSGASAVWDPATGERKTVIALRDLAHSPDRSIRERAYRAELAAWQGVEIPLAASLNGVKGTALTLDKRRGWIRAGTEDPLRVIRKSAFQSRISEKTLEALIAVLEDSLPLFRRYLKAKASLLGIGTCAFYDLFAPVGTGAARKWSWETTADFIPLRFDRFDPGMGTFARRAFAASWIDAQGREGKVGGAYCMGFPLAGESRILCNFEGSFDSVTTVAHELGHAWHHELLKDLPRSQSLYPMTLAETASIFAETIVFEDALREASGPERLGLIEGNLKDGCQVIVDILSRFYFERALFEKREQGELPAEELKALMIDAQKRTYGEGLDPECLHPYMWAVKSHYYRTGLGFYNYPYAFGLLFSLGLYSRFQQEGPSFAGDYRRILRLTGQARAEDVARSAGFNIEQEDFWRQGMEIIARRIEEFEKG